jgi:flagellar protein FliO/FliZ
MRETVLNHCRSRAPGVLLLALAAPWCAAAGAEGTRYLQTPYGRVLGGLLLVLAAIGTCAWLLRRTGAVHTTGSPVRVLGGASLGPRERVVLVRVGATEILLGVAPGRVQRLLVLPVARNAADVASP